MTTTAAAEWRRIRTFVANEPRLSSGYRLPWCAGYELPYAEGADLELGAGVSSGYLRVKLHGIARA
jgi:hypothetical protein